MAKGRYGGPQKRRSPRHDKKFKATLEYEGKTYEIRTINISKHGVLLPRRNPPSIGSQVKLTITIMNETSIFEGIVIRHANCLVNGVKTTGIGIDIISPGYNEFVKDKITIS
ncbi:MAG: PilZ domain-containing protein [Candidatus Hodarchaeales archaeon]|jgi:hypothetical protein